MDILIPNSWLKKYLDTTVNPNDFAKHMSLCGPSIEKITKTADGDHVYSIEITTNRVDSASVLGIAREAGAILPRFGIKARLKENNIKKHQFVFSKRVKYLDVQVDSNLCPRFTAVLINNVKVKESPKEIKNLLEKVGVRPINNVVDVSNYIMHELGQPVHTFDYDKITGSKMTLRESHKGEELITLDGKKFKLNGGDIVIEDGSGKLIDLCGIMGGENSMIDQNTKNVLLFVQVYDEHKIRKSSMSLAQRSEAAVLFEKGLDTEQVGPAILEAIKLIEELTGGNSVKEIIDIYPKPYKPKTVNTTLEFLKRIIGVDINQRDIVNYLTPLGFNVTIKGKEVAVAVPSYRAKDIALEEDIAEEIARIYGYHNLPNELMSGSLPSPRTNKVFKYEQDIKQFLVSMGAFEVMNSSLTDKLTAGQNALELKNPLGTDTMFLRTSLMPQLINNINQNPTVESLHLFELSNVYLKKSNNLPNENLVLSGIIKGISFRESKGMVQGLLNYFSIDYSEQITDDSNFKKGQKINVISGKLTIGSYGNLLKGNFYYEFPVENLINSKVRVVKFEEPSKFPPQIEDITLVLPEKTYIGEVIENIISTDNHIQNVELTGVYNDAFTFRIRYHSREKTLNDTEVEQIRKLLIGKLKSKYNAVVK